MKTFILFSKIMKKFFKYGIVLSFLLVFASLAHAVRIKDIAMIKGVRSNQLVGYGLVVGLDGTGDGKDSEFTIQSMARMLQKMGMAVDPDDINVENVAAVMVTADLPPFAKVGNRIDVTVSSIGDAETIYGGILLMTPLKAANGHVYAVAQGPIIVGGFSVGGDAAKVSKNFPTVGRIVDGALIEKEIPSNFSGKTSLTLLLHNPDFTTASRVAKAINASLYGNLAQTPDAGSIDIVVPEKYEGNLVELITLVEGVNVTPDTIARVVINERTGTVVVGADVRISTVAIAHGNLSLEIKESSDVSQPLPFSDGETQATPDTEISIKEEKTKLLLIKSGVTISSVVKALNALGVSPRDLITIFQTIKAAGALQARVEVI